MQNYPCAKSKLVTASRPVQSEINTNFQKQIQHWPQTVIPLESWWIQTLLVRKWSALCVCAAQIFPTLHCVTRPKLHTGHSYPIALEKIITSRELSRGIRKHPDSTILVILVSLTDFLIPLNTVSCYLEMKQKTKQNKMNRESYLRLWAVSISGQSPGWGWGFWCGKGAAEKAQACVKSAIYQFQMLRKQPLQSFWAVSFINTFLILLIMLFSAERSKTMVSLSWDHPSQEPPRETLCGLFQVACLFCATFWSFSKGPRAAICFWRTLEQRWAYFCCTTKTKFKSPCICG